VSGAGYTGALGKRVNALALALSSHDRFTDDEEAWAKEQKCTPPYVLVQFGPSKQHSCTGGHIKDEGPSLTTYDCFSSARDELRANETKVLPSLISALTCRFGSAVDTPVRFRPIDKEFFGLTTGNRVLHDIRFESKISAYASRRLTADQVRIAVQDSTVLAGRINPKVSRFFHLGLEEDDLLKRFLYFFLSIEIETHAAFSAIDHSMHLAGMLRTQPRVGSATTRFFEAQRERWTTLKDRFVWCALCVWTHLADSDVDEFIRLKKTRDEIAHGRIAAPPAESVAAAERLAATLLRPKV
jgi:hypothetical protein